MIAVLQVAAGSILTWQSVSMLGSELELGPNVTALLGPLVVAVGAWIGTRRATTELRPNGGGSIKDAIDRIDTRLENMETRQLSMDDRMVAIEDKVGAE